MSLFRKNDGKTEHLWFEERLSAYLDDELSSQERSAVEHHLARCQDCQWNLRTLRQTVRLTKELPTVPVPRVFTIPAPAQKPVRARQRRWGLGLLQGATALVALLLVFTVAGDVVFTGLAPSRSAAPIVMQEQAVVDSAATEAAEEMAPQALKAASVPAPAAESETTAEKSVAGANTEPAAPAQPTAMPEATAAPVLREAPAEPAGTMGPTSEPQASALGASQFESPLEATQEAAGGGAVEAAPGAAPASVTEPAQSVEPTSGAESASDVQVEVTIAATPEAEAGAAYAAPTPAEPEGAVPPADSAGQEPTIVAAAPTLPQQANQERAGEREQIQAAARDPLATWFQIAEIVLGGTFILLAAATIAVMIRRRRAR